MADNSKIEWTDATWTPIRARNRKTGKIGWHCEHATTGCEFCYAEGINKRLGTGLPFKPGHQSDVDIFLDQKMLLTPWYWKKSRRIFVCSMTDLFARFVRDDQIDKIFAIMALCHQHEFQVCTKRADRMHEYMTHPEREARWMNAVADLFETDPNTMSRCYPIMGQRAPWLPLPNVWLGVSAERQQEADERIPHLLKTPAAIRFASCEPLLGPLDLYNGDPDPRLGGHVATETYIGDWWPAGAPKGVPSNHGLDWVIVGGESGPRARPMEKVWAESLRDQCNAAEVPFFMKQMARKAPIPPDLMVREFPQ